MIVVTGGAGFIGSNIVRALNQRGVTDILVVDNLQDGHKFRHLVDCQIMDYLDQDDFLDKIQQGDKTLLSIKTIFHEGACSATTEWDGRYMMKNNYDYSKIILHYALAHKIPFIYASSAAIYGSSQQFKEVLAEEKPLNVYGYSKFLFDQYVRRILPTAKSQVVGLRYFNVYGPHEDHKGGMASVAFHLNNQLKEHGIIQLFSGCDGYDDGEQRRDFIYIDDVVNVNLWFMDHANKSGIFNVGTGRSQPFNDVAQAILKWHGCGKLTYIPFPDHLRGSYQSFTEADLTKLREIGYDASFYSVEEGVKRYLDWLNKQ